MINMTERGLSEGFPTRIPNKKEPINIDPWYRDIPVPKQSFKQRVESWVMENEQAILGALVTAREMWKGAFWSYVTNHEAMAANQRLMMETAIVIPVAALGILGIYQYVDQVVSSRRFEKYSRGNKRQSVMPRKFYIPKEYRRERNEK